ncbi:MAG: hypothetical protein ABI972_30180, partial [Acidobacteriota bacterium]
YLIMSWLYTVFVTIVTFGFLFLSLHKIDSTSFKIGSVATSWDFMAFSLEALTTARVSTIVPSSRVAVLMCYSEAFCAMLIFVILVFTVLTAAREAFREDVECFSRELRLTAGAIDSRIESVCMMTVGEVEKVLHESQFVLVNTMRKSRGLPEFGAPEVIEAKASYPTNS